VVSHTAGDVTVKNPHTSVVLMVIRLLLSFHSGGAISISTRTLNILMFYHGYPVSLDECLDIALK
jgi:hypothetical protein